MNDSKKDRKKVSQACENCRKKRTKCSGDKPKCEKCIQLNVECIYKTVTRRRGPKIGYLDDLMNKNIQKKLENLVMNNLISQHNIYKLAKNNYKIFNSSEILRKYINNDKQDNDIHNDMHNDIHMTNNNKEFMNSIIQKLSSLENNEYIIFRVPEEYESSTGKAIIFNKYSFHKYNYVEIDYSLIRLYFRYAQISLIILSEEIVKERIQNKTIFPGLLLAIYASAYMFKPKPDFKKSKKLARLAHKYIINYCYYPKIQVVQACMIISNCLLGTQLSWVLLGSSLKLSYILNLSKQDKTLSKIYNNERLITFWCCYCKDIVYSIITGRNYRYDIINIKDITNLIINLKITKYTAILVMNLVVVILIHIIKQYIGEIKYNDSEKIFLENKIKFWFKSYEHIFNYECEIENEKLDNIVTLSQLDFFYHTLKIVFYRHQSTSLVVNSSKKLKVKTLNNFEGIGCNFTKYEKYEKKNYDRFFQSCLNFLNRKNEIKENDIIGKNTFFKDNSRLKENYSQLRMDKENKDIPNIFSLNNFIYTKERKDRFFIIDYNLKPTRNKDMIDNTGYNEKQDINKVKIENENKKRSYDHAFSNHSDKYQDVKRKKIMDPTSSINCEEETHSNNNKFQSLEEVFMNNDENSINNIEDIIKDNGDDNDNDYSNNSDDDDNDDDDNDDDDNDDDDITINKNYYYFNENNDNNKEMMEKISYIENYIDKKNSEISDKNDKIDHKDEFFIVLNSFNDSKPYNSIEKYFNLKNKGNSEMETQEENPKNMLKKCFEITNSVTKKLKKIIHVFNKNKIIFNFFLAWCFYEIGIIYLIFYVDEGKNEYLENAKYFRDLLLESSKAYLAVSPYLTKYNEMLQEAEDSVKNNTKKLIIKDIL